MSEVRDNWTRLVEAVVNREKFRQLTLCESLYSSISSDVSSHYSFNSSLEDSTACDRSGVLIENLVKQIFVRPIQLTQQVIRVADDAATPFKQECAELKYRTEKLAALLWQAARASNDNYERPTRRIIDDTEQVLDKALALVVKCQAHGIMKRVFTIIPATAFRTMSSQLENSIGDVSWLLRVSASADDRADEHLGLPPIAANEPILCLIWEQITILCTGSIDDRSDAAASLASLARDNDRFGKLIIEEGGVGPLLKLVKDGKLDGQENAAKAIGWLGKDPESVEHMIRAGVCSVFAKILEEGPMKVQAVVAWAVSELAARYPECQNFFDQHNIIRLLGSHLAFETLQEHSKYAVVGKGTSTHAAVVLASSNNSSNDNTMKGTNNNDLDDDKSMIPLPFGNKRPNQRHNVVANTMDIKGTTDGVRNGGKRNSIYNQTSVSLPGVKNKAWEMEDPSTKVYMKAMATRALWHLAKGNSSICKSITQSRTLLCLAILLGNGPEEVQYNSAMALMVITAVAEEDAQLRRSAFKPNSRAYKAVVDQLFRIIDKADSELLIPCIQAIGNLAKTFKATETRMISHLVKLLDEREADVTREACIALTKFACSENYLQVEHSKAIIKAGGAKHLVQLVYLGEQIVQRQALILLCCIAMHVPDSEEIAQAEVLAVLEWAMFEWASSEDVGKVLKAKGKLELYQSRGSRGFH